MPHHSRAATTSCFVILTMKHLHPIATRRSFVRHALALRLHLALTCATCLCPSLSTPILLSPTRGNTLDRSRCACPRSAPPAHAHARSPAPFPCSFRTRSSAPGPRRCARRSSKRTGARRSNRRRAPKAASPPRPRPLATSPAVLRRPTSRRKRVGASWIHGGSWCSTLRLRPLAKRIMGCGARLGRRARHGCGRPVDLQGPRGVGRGDNAGSAD